MEHLDETDLKILRLLQDNSDMTTKELAEQIHLSPTPVYERVKKLEREGYIKEYKAILNREKLGKKLVVFCMVTLKEHTKEIGHQFVSDIVALKEVTECYNISGDYDFLLKIMVEDMAAYQDFVINSLGLVKNIGSAHSIFVMGEIKHSYALPI